MHDENSRLMYLLSVGGKTNEVSLIPLVVCWDPIAVRLLSFEVSLSLCLEAFRRNNDVHESQL